MANSEPHDQLTRHLGFRTSLPRESHTREEQITAGLDVPLKTPADVPNTAEFQATMASLMEAAKTTTAEFQAKMAYLMEAAKIAVNNAAAVADANANNSNAESGNNSSISTIPFAPDSLRVLSQGEQTTNLAHLLHMPDASNDCVDAAELSTPREPPKRSSGGNAKRYACKQCAYVATSKEDSWRHSRSHIPADKQLSCKHCEFVTEYKHHLEYHIRNHFPSKPFRCPFDSCSFVNQSMLNSHLKSHSTEYPFSCMDCSYQSKYCHSLKMHLRKYNHRSKPGIDVDDAEEALANDPSLDEEPEELNVRKVKATINDKEKDETNQLISLAQPTSAAVTASNQDELASLRIEEKILHEKLTQHVEPQMTEKKTESIQSIVNPVSNAQFDVDQLTPPNNAEFQATMASLMEAAKTAVNNAAAVTAANANNNNAESGNNSTISTIPSAIDSLRALSQGEQTTNLAHLLHMPDAFNDSVDAAELSTPREPPSSYGKAKKYPCRQCAYVAISKGDSWRHSRSHIPADKQLSCKQCEFVTEYKHHLEYHIRNHRYRPFQCPFDGYSGVNQSMLNSHMKREHSIKLQFSCFDCPFQSKYCHFLKVHLRKYNHRRKPGFDIDDSEEALANDPSLDEEGCSVQSGFN